LLYFCFYFVFEEDLESKFNKVSFQYEGLEVLKDREDFRIADFEQGFKQFKSLLIDQNLAKTSFVVFGTASVLKELNQILLVMVKNSPDCHYALQLLVQQDIGQNLEPRSPFHLFK
jgi:hypothetical protein